MENKKLKFILASASPRRKELLGFLNIPFVIMTKNIPEESHHKDPIEYSRHIAQQKGEAIFNDLTYDSFVVSADTIVCLENKIYGKPANEQDARKILSELSGKTHSVFTAVSLMLKFQGKTKSYSFVEESLVQFNSIGPTLLDNYLLTGDSLDKAGAYGIQGPSLTFISKVDGDYANVVGFPLSRFILECDDFFKPFLEGQTWQELF
jgi:septum formation protein